MKYIKNLWITNLGGVLLFQHVSDSINSADLFGSFVNALHIFASQIFDKGLTGFELGVENYFVKKTSSALFIANSDSINKKKRVYEEFEKIIIEFNKRYSIEMVSSWNSDVKVFRSFDSVL